MKKLLTIVFASFFCMLANNVTAASLTVSESSIDFGTISVGATDTRTFTVQGSSLKGKVSISSNNSELTVSPTEITKEDAGSGPQTVTLTLSPASEGSGNAKITVSSKNATSRTVTVTWTATSGGGGDLEVVELPRTVDKSNYSAVSGDMTYYNTDYFDFGPTDAPNTGRWAEWTVHLSVPGQYIITEDYYCPNGRGWRFQLLNGGGTDVVTPYETGNQDGNTGTKTYSTKWDLRGISADNYTLRVTNIRSYGQPKLRSLTFDFDGEILPEPDPISPWTTPGTMVNYMADNTTVFPNPERGFLDQLEAHVTGSSPYCVKGHDSYFNESNRENERLVLVLYYLDKLKTTTTLPSAVLNGFNEDMLVLRNKGYKCVLRYAYCQNDNNDATKSVMLGHISQLAPYWAANKDVIYAFQVGFIGRWGEWYYSANFENGTSHMNADRAEIVDALLAALPSDVYIQMRTPFAKMEYLAMKGISTSALTYSEAFTGTTKARLGHHNDAFFNRLPDTVYRNRRPRPMTWQVRFAPRPTVT